MMASVAFTGCVSDDSDDATDTATDSTDNGDGTDNTDNTDNTDPVDPVGADTQSTLDVIHERGELKCGIKTSQYGMGYLDSDTGAYSGLDVEYCRAIAAAIGLNPDEDINYIVASAGDRFQKLEDKEIKKAGLKFLNPNEAEAFLNRPTAPPQLKTSSGELFRK